MQIHVDFLNRRGSQHYCMSLIHGPWQKLISNVYIYADGFSGVPRIRKTIGMYVYVYLVFICIREEDITKNSETHIWW